MGESYKFNCKPKDVAKVSTPNRVICTKIPVPESLEIIEKSFKYQPESMNQQLLAVWDRADGSSVYDCYGNKWIDFSSSIFVNNVGHGNSGIIEAMREYIEKPLLCAYYYYTEIRSEFCEYLINNTNKAFDKVLLLTTGAETTECSLKISRLNAMRKFPEKKYTIAYLNGFHGKTMGAQTMSGKENGKAWVASKDPYIFHLPFPSPSFMDDTDIDDEEFGIRLFEEHLKILRQNDISEDSICNFIFEPYQGWGAIFYPKGYIKAMREFCDRHGCLIVSDEVQAGFGRTGRLFGYEHFGIVPDIVCCGKAISGALPLSAVLSRSELLENEPSLNSTHGGNPICCAASLANLKYLIENDLSAESARKGEIIRKRFNEMMKRHSGRIKQIHGKGLAYAALVVKPGTDELDVLFVDKVIERAFEKGLMSIRTETGTIKLGPPLNITDEALEEGLDVISEAFEEIDAEF